MFPIWLLVTVYGVRAFILRLVARGRGSSLAPEWLGPALAAAAFVTVLLSWSPWKIPGAYDRPILSDSASALRYVKREMRANDAVAVTEPLPPAALMELGKVDYDISVPLLTDFVYRKDGKLVDRNARARVISTIEQLEEAVSRNDRLWIVLNRNVWRSRGQRVMWGLPTGRFESFVRQNCDLKFQALQYSVFLWDVRLGKYKNFREHGPAFL